MGVYVELVFINNFIIDLTLLKCSVALSKAKTGVWQLLFCAIFTASVTLFFPFLKNNALLPVIKTAFGFLVVLLSIQYKNLKSYLFTSLIFFALTFFTGGAIIGISNILGIDKNQDLFIYLQFIPVVILGGVGLLIIKIIYRKKDTLKYTFNIEILIDNFNIKCNGFLDTGNTVYHHFTPIVFCSKEISDKIIASNIGKKTVKVPINTVNGFSMIKVILNTKIKIYLNDKKHIYLNVGLALTDKNLRHDVILHPSLIKE
ncbi:MAG: sigma-E processing peptidase SpoIIGA [Clostridia bacterium]|nr:sigma-E processing peptidase SpoIIGA [Clostridia bacterium]